MPVKQSARYEPGSAEDRAHRLLVECDVEVDRVFGVEALEPGVDVITFTVGGRARTAFAGEVSVLRVADGWDVPAPESPATDGA